MNRITIVIPTHNRHRYLSRIIDYYTNFQQCTILVLDSSTISYEQNLPDHFKYYHLKNINFVEKLFQASIFIDTEYTLMCADDDFWVKESIQECIEFLKMNKDYSSVQGKYIGFEKATKKINFIPSYLDAASIEDSQITQRLNASMSNYMPLFYAMHRTEIIQKVFSDNFQTGINHAILNELSVTFYSLIYGKHKVIDLLTYVRDDESLPTPVQRDNLKDISIKEEFKDEFEQFKTNIISLIADIDCNLNAKQVTSDALSKYINKIVLTKNRKSNRLKSVLKKYFYILKPIYHYFIKRKNIKKLFAKTQSIKGYPHSDIQSEKSWLEIYKIIRKYNVKD